MGNQYGTKVCPSGNGHLDHSFVDDNARRYFMCTHEECLRREYADGGTQFEPGPLDPDGGETAL